MSHLKPNHIVVSNGNRVNRKALHDNSFNLKIFFKVKKHLHFYFSEDIRQSSWLYLHFGRTCDCSENSPKNHCSSFLLFRYFALGISPLLVFPSYIKPSSLAMSLVVSLFQPCEKPRRPWRALMHLWRCFRMEQGNWA